MPVPFRVILYFFAPCQARPLHPRIVRTASGLTTGGAHVERSYESRDSRSIKPKRTPQYEKFTLILCIQMNVEVERATGSPVPHRGTVGPFRFPARH